MTSDQMSETSFIDPRDMSSSHAPISPPASTSDRDSSTPDTSLKASTSVPRKKRKSWGQVLPEPTTNLPPRKRAKTDAEKQQRLYERVQRNRAAAHNSRMRKQNEMEDVQIENNQLRQDLQASQDENQRLREELASIRRESLPISQLSTNFDHSQFHQDNENSTSPPSLTNGSSNDGSTPESDEFETEPTTSFTPDLASTVDVGVANYYEESGFGFSDGMIDDFNFTFQPQDSGIDIDNLINLDGLVDSKDSVPYNQDNWYPSYIPGFEPQMQYDPLPSLPSNMDNLPTLSGQPLF